MRRLAAFIMVYDDYEYLPHAIRSIYPVVDKILILWNRQPWSGQPVEVTFEQAANQERIAEVIDSVAKIGKVEILRLDRVEETEQRNLAMAQLEKEGYRWVWNTDSDEIMEDNFPDVIDGIINTLERGNAQVLYLEHVIYWRSLHFTIEPNPHWMVAMLRSDVRFRKYRVQEDAARVVKLEGIQVHHASYAKSPSRIRQKVANFSHAGDILPGWFENVFLQWTPDKENLHPTHPSAFKRAVVQKRHPTVLKEHSFFRHVVLPEYDAKLLADLLGGDICL